MDIALQTAWGWQIAMYLFLGGLGAGSLFLAALMQLRAPESLHKVVRFGSWTGTGCVAVGVVLLLTEVAMPLRALVMWESFSNFGSWMTIGAWLLFAGCIVGALFALCSTDVLCDRVAVLVKARKPLAILALVFATFIALYTGILLYVLVAHPLWNTVVLPVLFAVSALDTGTALILIYLAVRPVPGGAEARERLERLTLCLVVLELVVVIVWLATVAAGSEIGALSVSILLGGELAVPFWLLFVAVGLVVPGVTAALSVLAPRAAAKAEAAPKDASEKPKPAASGDGKPTAALLKEKPATIAAAACCLVGGCSLRFLVLLAGVPLWM